MSCAWGATSYLLGVEYIAIAEIANSAGFQQECQQTAHLTGLIFSSHWQR